MEAKIDDYCTANLLDPTDIDVTGSDEEILTHFSNTVATGNAEKILTDLCVILAHARSDIEMRTDVPPPPPQYRISAATQFAFSVANLLKDEDE